MLQKKTGTLLLCLVGMLAHAQIRTISFGHHDQIRYDLHTGRYDVLFSGKEVISDAYARCGAGDSLDSRSSYSSRTWSLASFSDSSGAGIRYTVDLTGAGRPAMQQVFYV